MAWKVSGKLVTGMLVAAVLAAAGSVYAYRQFFYLRKFSVVEDGVLFRSATMPNEATQRRILQATGARTIVILRTEEERSEDDWYPRERRIAEELGVSIRHIPMRYDTPPTTTQIAEFLGLTDDPAARPVLVHCEVGVIRTGMMSAVYRIERNGWSPEDACREYEAIAGSHAENPKRAAVREWILNYRPQFPKQTK